MPRPLTTIMFLLVIFTIYGGLHLYLYGKIKGAFPLDPWRQAALLIVLAALFLAPIAVRLAERAAHEHLAQGVAWIGYLWMGFVFLFFAASLCLDISRLLLWAAGHALKADFVRFLPAPRAALLLPALLALGIVVYGFWEARDLRLKHLEIRSAKLNPVTTRLRIVQISDVHLGMIGARERMARIIPLVKNAKPDILISTGDLLDGEIDNLAPCAAALRDLQPPYGKWAVMGNHEYYAGVAESLAFLRDAGFTVLRDEAAAVAGITIVGRDDPTGRAFGVSRSVKAEELMPPQGNGRFTLLLAHQPAVPRATLGRFDLQLSGHTHKGQLFPFSLITRIFFPLHSGFYALDGTSSLYVSPGTGTWGPPIRFLAPPEITIIDLIPPGK